MAFLFLIIFIKKEVLNASICENTIIYISLQTEWNQGGGGRLLLCF